MYILVSCALRQDCGAVPIDRRGRRETSVQPCDPTYNDSDVHHWLAKAAYKYDYWGSAYHATYLDDLSLHNSNGLQV